MYSTVHVQDGAREWWLLFDGQDVRPVAKIYTDDQQAKIVAALTFYEQHAGEHTCYVCDQTSLDVRPIASQTYVCNDENACIGRAQVHDRTEQREEDTANGYQCVICLHTGPDVTHRIDQGKHEGLRSCADKAACYERYRGSQGITYK